MGGKGRNREMVKLITAQVSFLSLVGGVWRVLPILTSSGLRSRA